MYPDFSNRLGCARSGLRNAWPVCGTGCASASSVAAYFVRPHVSANCHCATVIERIDASADASFPFASSPRYSLNARARRMPMIAITTISSISVKPSAFRKRKRQSRQHCDYKTDFEVPRTVRELDRMAAGRHRDRAVEAVGPRHGRGQTVDRGGPRWIERVAEDDDRRLRGDRFEGDRVGTVGDEADRGRSGRALATGGRRHRRETNRIVRLRGIEQRLAL